MSVLEDSGFGFGRGAAREELDGEALRDFGHTVGCRRRPIDDRAPLIGGDDRASRPSELGLEARLADDDSGTRLLDEAM